jgi:hypothetical protein
LCEYEEKIQEQREIIHSKEHSIQEYEKLKVVEESEGIAFKLKEVVFNLNVSFRSPISTSRPSGTTMKSKPYKLLSKSKVWNVRK